MIMRKFKLNQRMPEDPPIEELIGEGDADEPTPPDK